MDDGIDLGPTTYSSQYLPPIPTPDRGLILRVIPPLVRHPTNACPRRDMQHARRKPEILGQSCARCMSSDRDPGRNPSGLRRTTLAPVQAWRPLSCPDTELPAPYKVSILDRHLRDVGMLRSNHYVGTVHHGGLCEHNPRHGHPWLEILLQCDIGLFIIGDLQKFTDAAQTLP